MRKKISAVLFTGVMVGMLFGGQAMAANWPPVTPPNSAIPSAPALTAVAGDGKVVLNWTAVNTGTANVLDSDPSKPTPDGDVVDGYVIFYTEAGSSATPPDLWSMTSIDAGNVLTYTVTGLTNGTAYEFKVIAQDTYKKGSKSVTDDGAEQSSPSKATPVGGGGTTSTTTTTKPSGTTSTTSTTKATTTTTTTSTTLPPLVSCPDITKLNANMTDKGKGRMDVDHNGEINALDAALIVRKIKLNCPDQ